MHILLVQPRVTSEPTYPLALAGLIPGLIEHGHTVHGVDLQFEGVDRIGEVLASHPIRWVGATVMHHNAPQLSAWMGELSQHPGLQTFIAGALPTLDPAGALARTGADFAVVGEPEQTVAELVNALDPGRVPGIVHRSGGRIQHAPPRVSSPLHQLPIPDRSVFPLARYSFAMRSSATPYAMVTTSRGCHRQCPYCPVPALRPRGFDPRGPEAVVAEWRDLVDGHGIASLHIEDDSFLSDPGRVRAICRLLQARPLGAVWELVNGVRPDQVSTALLQEMAGAGCVRIVFSFEHISSGHSPAVGQSIEIADAALQAARAAGLRVGGYFIVGLPGVDLQETIASIIHGLRLGLDDANFVPFYESPGSAYAGASSALDATKLPARTAEGLTQVAQLAFFGDLSALRRLIADMIETPKTLPALASKAWELLASGGPIPMRDTP
jgi:radical SAM superfamily enzyme YgiQ (UPF0313 family)